MRASSRENLRRAVALLLPCVATVLAAVGLAWWWRAPLVAEATRSSAVERAVVPALAEWGTPDPRVVRGVFYGDSLTMSLSALARGKQGVGLPALVQQSLRAAGAPVDILTLTHAAFRPVQLAYLLDEVLAGRPRFAVIGINLRLLSPTWSPNPSFRFLPLSRKLSPSRQAALWPELREEGLGIFHPALYRLQEALALLYVMDGARLVGTEWLDARSHDVERALGLRRRGVRVAPLEDDAVAYASHPARHATARVLRRVHEELAAAGVWTLFYVSPVNPEALLTGGSPSPEELAARLDALRVAAGVAPEQWLDLHAELPASAFRDLLNHLRPSGLRTVAAKITHRLRPIVFGRAAPVQAR